MRRTTPVRPTWTFRRARGGREAVRTGASKAWRPALSTLAARPPAVRTRREADLLRFTGHRRSSKRASKSSRHVRLVPGEECPHVQEYGGVLDGREDGDLSGPQALGQLARLDSPRHDAEGRPGERDGRERPGADGVVGVDDGEGRGEITQPGEQRLGAAAEVLPLRRQHREGRVRLRERLRVEEQAQRRLQRHEPELVAPHGAVERVRAHPRDALARADDDPHLRTADQLIAGGGHEVGAGRDALRGISGSSPGIPAPSARRARRCRGRRRRGGRRPCRGPRDPRADLPLEALDAVVGRVDAEQEARLRADGVLVVLEVRAVRRPDLAEDRSRLLHHLRDPVLTADLHELAARDDDLRPCASAAEDDERRGGVVVHDRGSLAAREAPQERLDVPLAGRALPRLAVGGEELVAPRVLLERLERGLGEGGTADVGVEDHPGGVHDAHEPRVAAAGDPLLGRGADGGGARGVPEGHGADRPRGSSPAPPRGPGGPPPATPPGAHRPDPRGGRHYS